MKLNKKLIFFSLATIIVAGGIVTKSFADNPTVTPQKKASPEKIQEIKQSCGAIATYYGTFERVQAEQPFEPSEIARSDDAVNANTKEIITDYGVFVKNNNLTANRIRERGP